MDIDMYAYVCVSEKNLHFCAARCSRSCSISHVISDVKHVVVPRLEVNAWKKMVDAFIGYDTFIVSFRTGREIAKSNFNGP